MNPRHITKPTTYLNSITLIRLVSLLAILEEGESSTSVGNSCDLNLLPYIIGSSSTQIKITAIDADQNSNVVVAGYSGISSSTTSTTYFPIFLSYLPNSGYYQPKWEK